MKKVKNEGCSNLFIEKKDSNRIIEKIPGMLKENDTLVVCQLTCLGLSLGKLVLFFQELKRKKIFFLSIEDKIHVKNYCESSFIRYLDILARTEKNVKNSVASQNSVREYHTGKIAGRPSLPAEKITQIKILNKKYHYTYRQIAEKCNVSLGTVHKYLKEENQ